MSNNTIYVTSAERAVLASLPEALLEGWKIEDETGTAYEDEKALAIRAKMAGFKEFPELVALVQNAEKTGTFDPTAIKEIPQDALPELLFTIGARGIERVMAELMKELKSDEHLQGFAGFSQIRHKLLETNASIKRI